MREIELEVLRAIHEHEKAFAQSVRPTMPLYGTAERARIARQWGAWDDQKSHGVRFLPCIWFGLDPMNDIAAIQRYRRALARLARAGLVRLIQDGPHRNFVRLTEGGKAALDAL
jgi:hypothetical protein